MTTLSDGDAQVALQRLLGVAGSALEERAHLQRALESRIVIEQAKGMLAERYAITPDGAFELLRRAARNHRMKIHSLAADVVASRETPQQIAELVR